jgi:hypothetical protein
VVTQRASTSDASVGTSHLPQVRIVKIAVFMLQITSTRLERNRRVIKLSCRI